MDLHISKIPPNGGHNDLFLKIPLFAVDVFADSYYFATALENIHKKICEADVRRGMVDLLRYWVRTVLSCGSDETVYLPFDFSDQYTGCLQVIGDGENFHLSYGYSLIEGWKVNPLDPGPYCRQVCDFKAKKVCVLEQPRQDFVDAVNRAILEFESKGASLH